MVSDVPLKCLSATLETELTTWNKSDISAGSRSLKRGTFLIGATRTYAYCQGKNYVNISTKCTYVTTYIFNFDLEL